MLEMATAVSWDHPLENSIGTSSPSPASIPALVDISDAEALLRHARGPARELLATATAAIVRRLGDRGFCVFVADVARVVVSTEFSDSGRHVVDLALYPEVRAAIDSCDVVAIENVHDADILKPVSALLPARLGAVAAVPLVVGDRAIAVIVAQSTTPRTMAPRDLASARLEGRLAATLLDCQFGQSLGAELGEPVLPPGRAIAHTLYAADHPQIQHVPSRPAAPPDILIAENDTNQALLFEQILGIEGFKVRTASDIENTVAAVKDKCPDLILVDSFAAATDALAMARQLAAEEQTATVPILVICRTDAACLQVKEADLDTVDFLRKPCSPIELRARIEKSLSQAASRRRLRLTANVDELTGLGNLRDFRERLASEKSRIQRHGTPLTMLMIDVDKLKDINDRYGHPAGSEVLKAVADILRSEIRETDTAVRYGGDEFVVMLPHTRLTEGNTFARRVLAHASRIRPEGIAVSLSVGVAAWDAGPLCTCSAEGLLLQADSAAYRAKQSGGNQICSYDQVADHALSTSRNSQ